MLKCSYPGCAHRCVHLTHVHCRNEHGMEKNELINKYGKPKKDRFHIVRGKRLYREVESN